MFYHLRNAAHGLHLQPQIYGHLYFNLLITSLTFNYLKECYVTASQAAAIAQVEQKSAMSLIAWPVHAQIKHTW